LHVTDTRVDTAFTCELDHTRRDVEHDDFTIELRRDPSGELTGTAPDLEHALQRAFCDGLECNHPWIGAFGVRVERTPSLEISLRRVLLSDGGWIVDLHGSMIMRPGAPLPGCLPPSQAHTVAPTSANSPSSWILPAAFLPAA